MQYYENALFELSDNLVCTLDSQGNFLQVNKVWNTLLGYDHHNLIGKNISSLLSTASQKLFAESLSQKTLPASTEPLPLYVLGMDKMLHEFSWRILPTDAEYSYICVGKPTQLIDSENTQTKYLSNKMNLLFETMQEGVVIHNAHGEIIHFNTSALNILGLTSDQIMGRTSLDPMWKAYNEDMTLCVGENHPATIARKTGKIQARRLMGVQDSKQKLRWLLVTAVPIFEDSHSHPHQVLVTFGDHTAEIESKNQLLEREKELQEILDAMPALVGHWNKDLIAIRANKAYLKYFGKTSEEIRGLHIKQVLGPELYEKNLKYLQDALSGFPQIFEREIPLVKGGVKHTLAEYIPDIRNGVVCGIYVIVTDISALKIAEEKRREVESKLIASSKLSALGEMAAGIAHEVNNPLSVIHGSLEHLIERHGIRAAIPSPIAITDLSRMLKATQRISNIVRALSMFSRNGEADPMWPIKMKTLIDDLMELCKERFVKSQIDLKVEVPDDLIVECRSSQISQVLMNLLNNAFDAVESLQQKWVTLKISKENDSVKMIITDSGSGIPIETTEKMMLPFFTTKSIGKGTGLGLSISSGIIESHRGTLKYNPTHPHTQFEVCIPMKQIRIRNQVAS